MSQEHADPRTPGTPHSSRSITATPRESRSELQRTKAELQRVLNSLAVAEAAAASARASEFAARQRAEDAARAQSPHLRRGGSPIRRALISPQSSEFNIHSGGRGKFEPPIVTFPPRHRRDVLAGATPHVFASSGDEEVQPEWREANGTNGTQHCSSPALDVEITCEKVVEGVHLRCAAVVGTSSV